MQNEKEWAAYVGAKSDYYLKKWHKAKKPETAISWNWPAFLFSPLWFAYRRMVKWAGIFMLASVLSSLFFPGLMFIVIVVAGMYGNALYYRSTAEMIQKTTQLEASPEKRLRLLEIVGGTSTTTLIIFIAISILWGFIRTFFVQ